MEDENGKIVESQTSLIWNREQKPDNKRFEVSVAYIALYCIVLYCIVLFCILLHCIVL